MPDYGNPDIYRTPRYSSDVEQALKDSATSAMWDDWDLDGLLTDVPHKYAAKLGAKHGIFCCTGTAGLHASLMALELLPGDEVVLPCMTFIRVATVLVHLGLVPVLADIDTQTGNLNPDSVKRTIGPKTRAVIAVHMWGIPADMTGLVALCQKKGLYLIEDFSHAHYSEHQDGVVGGLGTVSFCSLQRKKTLSVGEGGLVVTNDSEVYHRLRAITSPGSFKGTPNYNEFSGFGLNLRMSPFSGVVARTLFEQVDSIVAARAAHAQTFDELLGELPKHFTVPQRPGYVKTVSAYGYKPALKPGGVSLEQLMAGNSLGLWKFSAFSYDDIRASPFWRKSRAHYPFCQQITPKAATEFPGYDEYIRGRISLSVPTVGKDYWTKETVQTWRSALAKIVS